MSAQLFEFPTEQSSPPKQKKAPQKLAYTGEFIAFWALYPPRFNSSKFLAFKAWNKLDTDEHRQAMIAVPIYARSRIGKDQEYTAHAATWLNGKYFETVAVPSIQSTISVRPAEDWPAIMRLYRMTSNWKQENGPPPNSPNCRVPPHLLSGME